VLIPTGILASAVFSGSSVPVLLACAGGFSAAGGDLLLSVQPDRHPARQMMDHVMCWKLMGNLHVESGIWGEQQRTEVFNPLTHLAIVYPQVSNLQ
jgi:hypothetical protein